MDATCDPDGYNVGWNCGAVGGQSLMHAHLHVMPRFRQEPLAGQGIRALLQVRRQPLGPLIAPAPIRREETMGTSRPDHECFRRAGNGSAVAPRTPAGYIPPPQSSTRSRTRQPGPGRTPSRRPLAARLSGAVKPQRPRREVHHGDATTGTHGPGDRGRKGHAVGDVVEHRAHVDGVAARRRQAGLELPCRHDCTVATPAPAARRAMSSRRAGDSSVAWTAPAAPTILAIATAMSPLPAPMSATRMPPVTPSAVASRTGSPVQANGATKKANRHASAPAPPATASPANPSIVVIRIAITTSCPRGRAALGAVRRTA